MSDVVVHVPKADWDRWCLEVEGGTGPITFDVGRFRPRRAEPTDRVYVAARGRVRCVFQISAIRRASAGHAEIVAARPARGVRVLDANGDDRQLKKNPGSAFRYRDWQLADEVDSPDWRGVLA